MTSTCSLACLLSSCSRWPPPRPSPGQGGLQGLLLPFTCMTSTYSRACLLSSCSRWPPPRPPAGQGGLQGLLLLNVASSKAPVSSIFSPSSLFPYFLIPRPFPGQGGLQGLLLPFTCMTSSTCSLACLLSSCSRWPPPRPPAGQGGLQGLLQGPRQLHLLPFQPLPLLLNLME